jgi:hypothetical protein
MRDSDNGTPPSGRVEIHPRPGRGTSPATLMAHDLARTVLLTNSKDVA